MLPTYSLPPHQTSRARYDRKQTASVMEDFEAQAEEPGQRAFAREHGIPRSTFQSWHARYQQAQIDPVAAFFETPAGLECLHRIVRAAQFVLVQLAGGSVRHCSTFLELSRLDRFAAASTGAQQKDIVAMEQAICDYGDAQRTSLATQMPRRQLIVAEDENFHQGICLVAIDTESGYILLERYAQDRKAETWNDAMADALCGLNVQIVQCVSDQAKALVCHIETGLGVAQAPDLFHVQHELCKATALALARQTKEAQEALEQSSEAHKQPAQQTLEQAQHRQARARAAVRGLSADYHPIDWHTGEPKRTQELESRLVARIQEIQKVAEEAGLSESSRERIQKAGRVVPKMVATFALFWRLMGLRVAELGLNPRQTHRFIRYLFAGTYLLKMAPKQRLAESKRVLKARACGLLNGWSRYCENTQELTDEQKAQLEQVAQECSSLFVRASSIGEGRNAHLRRHQLTSHRLSDRKLGALTVLHNFFVMRSDRTTAAERFFGQKPKDLFEHLIETLPVPARPAARRR